MEEAAATNMILYGNLPRHLVSFSETTILVILGVT